GWIAQFPDPAPTFRTGLWDLGQSGTISLVISNQPSATGYKYVVVQVTELLTPGQPVTISFPGATFVHGSTVAGDPPDSLALSSVVVTQSVWRLPNCPSSETLDIVGGATSGSTIDSIVVDTLCIDITCPTDIPLNTETGQCSAHASWSLPSVDGCII